MIVVFATIAALLLPSLVISQSGPLTGYPDCVNGPLSKFPICDPSLVAVDRARDIVSRLNVSEKVIRVGQSYGANAIPRVGLPPYHWRQNAVHGLGPGVIWTAAGQLWSNCTVFPHVINIAATFDRETFHLMGEIVSTEARAFANVGRAGLDWFTPNINIFRDPRWGRGQETPGEDPLLTSIFGVQFVLGLQRGADPRYIKVIADCKHYAGYDLENWGGNNRVSYNAIISDLDLVETYLPSFEACVTQAHVESVMCSYNAVNGVPSCANPFFIQTILRGEYGFDGWVVSDCGAVGLVYTAHKYYPTPSATIQGVLRSGVDLDCGPFIGEHGDAAYADGSINDRDLDTALIRAFTALIRLGYFDDPSLQPYRQIDGSMVNSAEHQRAALMSGVQSIVLLKNDNNALPLAPSVKTIALIGPFAAATEPLLGNYQAPTPYIISIQQGFINLGFTVNYVEGCTVSGNSTSQFGQATDAAKNSDVVIFVGGIDNSIEYEGGDRTHITLPGVQLQLIQALESVKPVIVVMIGAGQVDLSYCKGSVNSPGIIWAGYPGQSGGRAVALILAGAYSPAGKLPVTMYPADYVNQVPMTDQSMRPSKGNPGRTYKFYTGNAIYSFGDGLSYTTFQYTYIDQVNPAYRGLDSVEELDIAGLITASARSMDYAVAHYRVNVTNTGKMTSDNIVLGFVTPGNASHLLWKQTAPIKALFDFARVHDVPPGRTVQVFFSLTLSHVASVDANGDKSILPGDYTITFDNDVKLKQTLRLNGEAALLKSFPRRSAEQIRNEQNHRAGAAAATA